MTPEFAQSFTTRLQELVAGLHLFHLPSQSLRPPQVWQTMLPVHVGEWQEGEFFPYLCWCYTTGEIGLKPHPFTVRIDAGLRVDTSTGTLAEQIQSGTADCLQLVQALRGLCKDHLFAQYKLTLPFNFQIGDRGSSLDNDTEGEQPHPYYRVRFALQFLPR